MAGPLDQFQFRIENFKSLADATDWLEFGQVTLIVGRNNSGKSSILDGLATGLGTQTKFNPDWRRPGAEPSFHIRRKLDEPDLRNVFSAHSSGGPIRGNHWEYARQHVVGQDVSIKFDENRNSEWIIAPALPSIPAESSKLLQEEMRLHFRLPQVKVIGIKAERNVIPEMATPLSPVKEDGSGLTNLVRSFLYDSSLPMEEVEVVLLDALNSVFLGEMQFQRIICRQDGSGPWEIFLESGAGKPI